MDAHMKKILALIALWPALVWGQAFNLFQPATGVLVGSTTTYVTTAAASSNVISLWTGTCNTTTFLQGGGACVTLISTLEPTNDTTGSLCLGQSSLPLTAGNTGTDNTCLGSGTLAAITSGEDNTAVGFQSGKAITTGL